METRPIHKDQLGFTLIETCIALVLIMIISSGVLPLFVYAVKYNSAAAIRAEALAIAQRKLEQLRASPFTSCTSSANEVVTVGSTTTGSLTYTVDVIVNTNVTNSLKNIQIKVTPQGRSTSGEVYSGPEAWMRGQVIIYTERTTLGVGPNLG
jgi:Tfp pilus assembly protein PilV